ncbi:protein EFFECTOR OF TRANSCRIPTION 2 [Sesamum angolense]|uniref:Protein EFFECTOR OF TRANSCRIPTION 2 n=1 Tax=Sesamum angolense TaxID=2727404 RepID=A0AAE1WEB9_9LAMI|nr:protein EFFECTOR OF TRANSCRIPTION 2 [Sesamum angolense]
MMECGQLLGVVCLCFHARRQTSLFTCKRWLHGAPKLITVGSCLVGAPPTATSSSSVAAGTSGRLKREDFRRTGCDSVFSEWKTLVGASDWKDHLMGKEGAERYRTQNVPHCVSCPGVYELGIAMSFLGSGREHCKLDSSSVVPVYVGQADNVRTRLQRYGRDGAHLEYGSSNEEFNNSPGLFSEIFSKGLSIVYRWAPMKSKKDAKNTEDQLLEIYDYAWNKRSNGGRSPDDILKKLDCCAKKSQFSFSLLHMMLHCFHQKQVVDKIRTCDQFLLENNQFNSAIGTDNKGTMSRVLRIIRLQPGRPQSGFHDDSKGVCGVTIGYGSICTKAPVEGRKRCAEHKGMKVNGLISNYKRMGKAPSMAANNGSGTVADRHCDDLKDQRLNRSREANKPYACEHPNNEKFAPKTYLTRWLSLHKCQEKP